MTLRRSFAVVGIGINSSIFDPAYNKLHDVNAGGIERAAHTNSAVSLTVIVVDTGVGSFAPYPGRTTDDKNEGSFRSVLCPLSGIASQ